MEKIDMHVHTFNSDGDLSTTNVFLKAYLENVKKIVITDHNLIKDNNNYEQLKERFGVDYMMGTEISTSVKGMHILGYGTENLTEINRTLEGYEKLKEEYIVQVVNKLKRKFNISEELLTEFVKYRSNIKLQKDSMYSKAYSFKKTDKFMQDEKNDINTNLTIAALNEYFVFTKKDLDKSFNPDIYRRYFITPEHAIKLIHAHGGVAVLAHPQTLSHDFEVFKSKFRDLNDLGIDGFEMSRNLKDEQIMFLKQYRDKLTTIGTDFHHYQYEMGSEDSINAWEQTKERIR